MKVFIKPLELEVETERLPYRDNQSLRDRPDFVIEATDGRIFTVPRYGDIIVEFESAAERARAEAELDDYYRKCIRYRYKYSLINEAKGITVREFVADYPFEQFK